MRVQIVSRGVQAQVFIDGAEVGMLTRISYEHAVQDGPHITLTIRPIEVEILSEEPASIRTETPGEVCQQCSLIDGHDDDCEFRHVVPETFERVLRA